MVGYYNALSNWLKNTDKEYTAYELSVLLAKADEQVVSKLIREFSVEGLEVARLETSINKLNEKLQKAKEEVVFIEALLLEVEEQQSKLMGILHDYKADKF